jgi:hypothetical protein
MENHLTPKNLMDLIDDVYESPFFIYNREDDALVHEITMS